MKLEIYGVSREELNHDSWGERIGQYLGSYDGVKFSSDKYQLKDLEEFDYLHKGFQDGVDAGDNANFKIQLVKILNSTKGVGPKTFDSIMDTVKEMGI